MTETEVRIEAARPTYAYLENKSHLLVFSLFISFVELDATNFCIMKRAAIVVNMLCDRELLYFWGARQKRWLFHVPLWCYFFQQYLPPSGFKHTVSFFINQTSYLTATFYVNVRCMFSLLTWLKDGLVHVRSACEFENNEPRKKRPSRRNVCDMEKSS